MAEYADREHFIPLRRDEMVDMLCAHKDLTREEREQLTQFCKLITAVYHFEYQQVLDRLKRAYAPFDPDSDCVTLKKSNDEERAAKLMELFAEFTWLMERANFRQLKREDYERIVQEASEWGLVVDVDFSVFEQLAVFVRGEGIDKRTKRRASHMWRKEEIRVPIYRRLAMILKLKPHKRFDARVNTDGVFLQIFKNIPKADVDMLLPGARTRMSRFDKGKVGMPLVSGLAAAVWNIADDVAAALGRGLANPSLLFWGVATGAIGYGTKSYYNYSGTKQRYNLNLTQVLYFQNLDTNAGVLYRLIDEAEEQEAREAILAYYFLWRYAGEKGWLPGDLDDYVELELERTCNLKVDFEIGDALDKLEKKQLVEKVGDRYRAQPITKALAQLDYFWDNYFKFNNPEPEAPPIPAPGAAR